MQNSTLLSSLSGLALLGQPLLVWAHPGHVHGPADHPAGAATQSGSDLLVSLFWDGRALDGATAGGLLAAVLIAALAFAIWRQVRAARTR